MDDLKDLMVKKPFVRMIANGTAYKPLTTDLTPKNVVEKNNCYEVYTQGDFLREYYPSGHSIYNPEYYPDRYKKDPETGKTYKEEVVRCSFAFQQVIALKHTITLCGNDIQFSLSKDKATDADNANFVEFMRGWETHDMEIAWYECVRSAKITADVAFVGFMHKGKFRWKVLSYLNGDTLYPHYDRETGKLDMLIRSYSDESEDGKELIRWAEVWDDKYLYRFKQERTGVVGVINKVKENLGLSGYTLVSKEPHNFPFIPVAYYRASGPCWQYSQDSIDKYELSFSYMSQNNMAFAFPIMYLKGDEISVSGDPMTDSVKVINMDSDSDAGFLTPPNGSEFFKMQLQKLYDMILEQSSIPKVPEVKSGDLPGIAVKLLFSPSIEKAMEDAQMYKGFLNGLVKIFKHGYGVECGRISAFTEMEVSFYIEPYVHMNTSELITNLATAVQNGFLSKQTASEKIRMYSTAQEFDRIIREQKKEQEYDILSSLSAKVGNKEDEPTDDPNKTENQKLNNEPTK